MPADAVMPDAAVSADPPPADAGRIRVAVAERMPALVDALAGLVRIPSVHGLSHPDGLRRCAGRCVHLLRTAGMLDAAIVDAGAPAVVARRRVDGARLHVALYAHHDVQPPGPRERWSHPPFTPLVRAGRMYGRGTADDKGGVVAHVGALGVLAPGLPLDVSVVIDGEEEIGSPHLAELLGAFPDVAAADVVVVNDGFNHRVGAPSLITSTRGCVNVLVEVRTHRHDVHSGAYGGLLPDAATVLARLLATLHDGSGDVAVRGLKGAGGGARRAHGVDENALRADAGVLDGVVRLGRGSAAERLWQRPALAVTALESTPVDDARNQLAPVARAVVSARIAPGQASGDAEAALHRHLREATPWGAEVHLRTLLRFESFSQNPADEAFQVAEGAVRDVWGAEPAVVGDGGSLPVAAWGGPDREPTRILLGLADPSSREHGPDESLDLSALERTTASEALLLERLAREGEGTA
jgi:acetylornithine deacetylase/succinyl-diaminopimelate desuccinylase-like protein